MKVLLVGPDYEENLSIRYLSSSLIRAGHIPILCAFNSAADIRSVAEAAQTADLVGLSMCFQSRAREFLHLARVIKSQNADKLIVAGGHYASCAAEPLLANHPEIDIVVIHEGENTLVEIVGAMTRIQSQLPRIAGIAYRDRKRVCFSPRRATLPDLDALPFPDRCGPIHSIAGVPTSYLMGSRGCYGSCAYCCITTLHRMAPGKRFRQRSVEQIADEMSLLYHERSTRQFVFHDDNFLVPSAPLNQARISALERALKERGINDIALVIKARPADASREVLRQLKDLGLVRIFLGVESSTERGLSALERAQTVEQSGRALELCAELDISAQFTLMIFHPDATLETLCSDVAFMRRFCGNPLNFCRAEIYAGTPLEKRMIALGRAKGDYLARVYELPDPVADLTCNIALQLFDARCWSTGSLMQHAIGLDHTAAVIKRFRQRPEETALCRRTSDWVRNVNLDTINFLQQVIDLAETSCGTRDPHFRRALSSLREREAGTRSDLLQAGFRLRSELASLDALSRVDQVHPLTSTRLRLTRQIAAGLLAMGIPAAPALQAVAQEVKSPPALSSTDQESSASVAGQVTDPSGAVIANAEIRIRQTDTGVVRLLRTDQAGEYLARGLAPGRYNITVISPGFAYAQKTDVLVKAGTQERADFKLNVKMEVCEYAAAPLQPEENLIEKKKPFTYFVGQDKDGNSFQGIAKLVYGDSRAWVQIFEANRNSVALGFIPEGTPILIPKRQRVAPKLISKIMPAYPPAARKENISGDVVMDVTLKNDGTVDAVAVIEGNPLLASAAVNAVKKWRYRPLLNQGKPIDKFVVVISFSRGGKVR